MLIEEIIERSARVLAAQPYYPCVLLVHPTVRTLQVVAEQVARQTGWQELAVGQALSAALAGQPAARRSTLASSVLDRVVAGLRPGPILCTDLPLLFEPSLGLDPLGLLHQWSRGIPLVATWLGSVSEHGLAYAVPEHAHYRLWPRHLLGDLRSYLAL